MSENDLNTEPGLILEVVKLRAELTRLRDGIKRLIDKYGSLAEGQNNPEFEIYLQIESELQALAKHKKGG